MAGGVMVFDANNDGHPDIFITNGADLRTLNKNAPKYHNRLFLNDGHGGFTDVTDLVPEPAAHRLRLPFRTLRGRGKRLHALFLLGRSVETQRTLVGNVGGRHDPRRRAMSVPQSPAHGMYAHARSGRAFPGARPAHGLEPGDHGAHGQALWTHRPSRAPKRSRGPLARCCYSRRAHRKPGRVV